MIHAVKSISALIVVVGVTGLFISQMAQNAPQEILSALQIGEDATSMMSAALLPISLIFIFYSIR